MKAPVWPSSALRGPARPPLLGLLAGLDLPSRGHVALAGQNLGDLDEEARPSARAVGFVFQSFHLPR